MVVSIADSDRAAEAILSGPVSLQILWTRLIAIADEAATTLVRTSFSPVVRESNDFSCAVLDSRGGILAENTIGIPSFNMTMQRTLESVLELRKDHVWRDGDVIITNDPWMCSGHLPDVTTLTPVFLDDELIAWTGSIAHMADIGGAGWRADTREVYEEGLFIPPTLLLKAGEPNEDLIAIIRANVRLPDAVQGDLFAQVAAGRAAGNRLVDLMRELGIRDLKRISAEICGRADAAMRRAISAMPDGTWQSTVPMDGTGDEPIVLSVRVTVAGDEMTIDYDGTSDQVAKGLNTVFNYTEAYSCYPIKCALDPETPRNAGSYRAITVRAPEGSILNPRFPAAVNARQIVGHMLAAAIYEAIFEAVPDAVIAESGSAPTLRVVVSGHREDGKRFSTILFVSGGMGARPGADGLSATCFPSMVVCGSMEIIEAVSPIRVWSKQFAPDSGGAGKYRGGLGQVVRMEMLAGGPYSMSLFVDRVHHPARGLNGGEPGSASRVLVNGRSDGFPLKGISALQAGDIIDLSYPGGGGHGHPGERAASAVAEDLSEGLVTVVDGSGGADQ